jgi:hypothetical protein
MRRAVAVGTDYRERVITYLTLLSSEAGRQTLSQIVEPERLAFELCRIWFDDIYIAGHRYFDGLKGDFSPDAAEVFRSAFTTSELAALERFSQFLELRLDMLPKSDLTSRRIPDNDTWRNFVKDARYLLEDLDPHSKVRSRRLAEHLSAIDISDVQDLGDFVDTAVMTFDGQIDK